MAFVLGTALLAVLSLGAGSGCATVLGIESLRALETDAGAGGVDAPVPSRIECTSNETCLQQKPTTVSNLDCVEAACVSGRCVYSARDQDGDGLTVACASTDPTRVINQSANLDCDDTVAGIVAGSEADCSDGSFTLPGIGACRPGKKRCKPDGTWDACIGAIGKSPKELCDGKDDDCDGTVDNGCACQTGATRPCGPPQGEVGICKNGSQVCTASAWGTECARAVFGKERDCGTALDNDCNGQIDNTETPCLCGGIAPVGTIIECGVTGGEPREKECVSAGKTAVYTRCQ
jgi:hypothetical protein